MKTYNKEVVKKILANKKLRYYFLRGDLYMFGLYYFKHYFLLPSAPFHHEMTEDAMFEGGHKFLYWIMYGESAKTTWARIKIIHLMCYADYYNKRNIGWVGHDLKKAKKNVMAVSHELKGNKRLIEDFGYQFLEDPTAMRKKSKSKTFSSFSTASGVSFQGLATTGSTRGDADIQFRPDFYVIDDIENMKTARSIALTKSTIEYLEELLRGISVDCQIIILANRISKNGAVAWLEKHLDANPKALIHEVKVFKDKEHKIFSWPAKYVHTTEEADRMNELQPNKKKHVVSIEQKRHDLGSNGFKREMLNEPVDFSLAPIKLEWIRRSNTLPSLDTMELVIAVDPAISEKQSADFFAIAVVGRHRETGIIYVIESYKTRCPITQQIPLMINFHLKYPKAKMRIEVVAYQKALSQLLEAEKKNGHYISIDEYRPVQDKILRAHSVAPFIERGDVIFNVGVGMDNLIENLCSFPVTEDGHDDDVDATISGIEYFINTRKTPRLAF